MLNIYSLKSSINSNLLYHENRIVTLDEVKSDFLKPVRMNEGFVGSIVDFVRSIIRKIKEYLTRIFDMIFGGKSSSKSKSRSGGSGGSSSSSSSSYSSSDRTSSRSSGGRRPIGSYSTTEGWSASDADLIRRKLGNNYFADHFIWELHDWNDHYIDSISANVDKLDSVRIRLPGGKRIDSSVSSILAEINDYIYSYQSTGRVPKEYDTYVSYFKNDVNSAIERVFSISDGASYETQIMDKITNGSVRRSKKSYSEIMDLVHAVENESVDTDQISFRYREMISSLEEADESIRKIDLNTAPEEVSNVVTALSEFLQYKVTAISTIEHIHIKALRDRSEEYKSELKRFNNM